MITETYKTIIEEINKSIKILEEEGYTIKKAQEFLELNGIKRQYEAIIKEIEETEKNVIKK